MSWVKAGTRDADIVGYLEQQVIEEALGDEVAPDLDRLLDAIAIVARRLDEKAGPWQWIIERLGHRMPWT